MSVTQAPATRAYQQDGIDFLAARDKALLAFDTRLGKTLVALRASQKIKARRILVLAPAIGRLSWGTELYKLGLWQTMNARIVRPGDAPGPFVNAEDIVLVLAYDTLSFDRQDWTIALRFARKWDVMIVDEAQYLKTMGTRRTNSVYGTILPNVARTWLLTGTPTPNHAGELFPHLKALWPELLPGDRSRVEFEDHYCVVETSDYGRRVVGSKRQAELRQAMAPHVLRLRKHDVFRDLPPVANNLVPLDASPDNNPDPFDVSVTEIERLLLSPDSVEAKSLRRELGEAKAPGAVAWLQEQLSHDIIDKVVVFAWHRSVLDALAAGLADYRPARIDGSTSDKARQDAITRLRDDPMCRVFLGQIKACGTAIALAGVQDVAMVEPSWVPMENYQACSRVEDVQRLVPVTVNWLYAPDTLDSHIQTVLRRKTSEISALWD